MPTQTVDSLAELVIELTGQSAELSRMTGIAPADLFDATPRDVTAVLFLYGILGGKDVGKTTLINALAESRISHESPGISAGTGVSVVYVHHDDVPVLRERLSVDPGLEYELRTHDREVLRHVALVDLPDFDSKRNLPDHARRANEFKRFLDGFVWVTTVRKLDHPELLRQMASVAPKQDSFYCVVTFADEVVEGGKDSLPGLRELCMAKVRELYFDDFDPNNLFTICTLDPRRYDFPALRQRLVRAHSPDEIVHRQRHSACRSLRANVARVREHYRIDEWRTTIDRLLAEIPRRMDDSFSGEYWSEITDRVARLDGPYRRMTARLFAHRIWGWPVLSVLMFPISSLVSYLGGRLFFESGVRWSDYHQLPEILTVDGLSMPVRLQQVSTELRAKYLRLHQTFGDRMSPPLDAGAIIQRWSEALDEQDRRTGSELQQRYRRPRIWTRWVVYLPLLWFPIAQPILETYLRQPDLRTSGFFRGLALTCVSLLSARYLLQSAAVLSVVYTLWLLWFYASSARQIARRRLTDFGSLRMVHWTPQLAGSLAAGIEYLRDEFRGHADRLSRLEAAAAEAMDA